MLTKSKPEAASRLWEQAQQDVDLRYRLYEYLSHRKNDAAEGGGKAKPEPALAAPGKK